MGSHSFLLGMFLAQVLNPGLSPCRWIFYLFLLSPPLCCTPTPQTSPPSSASDLIFYCCGTMMEASRFPNTCLKLNLISFLQNAHLFQQMLGESPLQHSAFVVKNADAQWPSPRHLATRFWIIFDFSRLHFYQRSLMLSTKYLLNYLFGFLCCCTRNPSPEIFLETPNISSSIPLCLHLLTLGRKQPSLWRDTW